MGVSVCCPEMGNIGDNLAIWTRTTTCAGNVNMEIAVNVFGAKGRHYAPISRPHSRNVGFLICIQPV